MFLIFQPAGDGCSACSFTANTALEFYTHMTEDHAALFAAQPAQDAEGEQEARPRGFLRMRRLSGDLLSGAILASESLETASSSPFEELINSTCAQSPDPFTQDEEEVS